MQLIANITQHARIINISIAPNNIISVNKYLNPNIENSQSLFCFIRCVGGLSSSYHIDIIIITIIIKKKSKK